MGVFMTEKQYNELMKKRQQEKTLKKSCSVSQANSSDEKCSLKNSKNDNLENKIKSKKTPLINKGDFNEVYYNIVSQDIEFIVPGDPFGKERPRVYNGVAITPEKTKNYEEYVRFCFLTSIKNTEFEKIAEGAIGIEITALFKIPQNYPKWKKMMIAIKKLLPIKKPDFDNIAKIISDSLNDIAWEDDAQITDCLIKKRYLEDEDNQEGMVKIRIYTVDISEEINI